MEHLGIEVSLKSVPPLDPGFLPMHRFNGSFLRTARQPFHIAVERPGGTAVLHTRIHGTADRFDADVFYAERAVKTLLWARGGFRVLLAGDEAVCRAVAAQYASGGPRDFDAQFLAGVCRRPFSVERVAEVPEAHDQPRSVSRRLDGCRIGFDAGGSDRKVAALMDGQVVYSEETVWSPKEHADPAYHYSGIVAALRAAAARLPRVDAVGISTAGICRDDRLLRSALFLRVPEPLFAAQVPDIFLRAAADTLGPIPCAVANDGDVSALAGAMSVDDGGVLGLAMGTSEAAGYVDDRGRLTGWFNELAFVPVAAGPGLPVDPWSGDAGCGASYFSQDAVIRLAAAAGISLPDALSPAEKLALVQRLADDGDSRADAVFDTVGVWLAHALAGYHALYGFHHVFLQGRVVSGGAGERLLARCRTALGEEYPALSRTIRLHLPDDGFRRVGQAVAAAALPVIAR